MYARDMLLYGNVLTMGFWSTGISTCTREFSMPSISTLNKIQQEGVDVMKAIKILREKGKMFKDVNISVDKMFLKKCTQYSNGDYVDAYTEGNFS